MLDPHREEDEIAASLKLERIPPLERRARRIVQEVIFLQSECIDRKFIERYVECHLASVSTFALMADAENRKNPVDKNQAPS